MYSDAATTKTARAATMNTNRAAPPVGAVMPYRRNTQPKKSAV